MAAPESRGGLEHLIYSCPPDGFFSAADVDGQNTFADSARSGVARFIFFSRLNFKLNFGLMAYKRIINRGK